MSRDFDETRIWNAAIDTALAVVEAMRRCNHKQIFIKISELKKTDDPRHPLPGKDSQGGAA